MRITIGQVMMVVALAALSLAAASSAPWEIASFPTLWVFLGVIDFLALRKLILRRPLRAFHYTCLIASVVAYLVMANLVATERLRLLSPFVRWYQRLGGGDIGRTSPGLVQIAEFWAACLLGLALGCALGWVAAWLERRRGWDIAAFYRGALVGFGVANVLLIIDGALRGWEVESRSRWVGNLVLLCVCLILGGLMGLSRWKSNTSDLRA
jgi:hypothetical protein